MSMIFNDEFDIISDWENKGANFQESSMSHGRNAYYLDDLLKNYLDLVDAP
jgi:hypothetical protein